MRNAKSRRGNQVLAMAVGAVGVMGLASVAYPAGTWDGGGTDNSWQTAANWDNNTVPNFASYQSVTFGTSFASGDTLINNRTGNTYIQSMTFLAGTPALTITGTAGTGNKLFFSSSPTITNNSTANQIINNNLYLYASTTVSGDVGSGTVTLGGVLSVEGTDRTLTVTGNANVTLAAVNSIQSEMYVKGNGKLTVAPTGALATGNALIIYDAGTFLYNSTTATSREIVFNASASGATLGGSGTIAGSVSKPLVTVTSGNTLSPGNTSAPGTLTFSRNLTFNNGSKYAFDANDLTDVDGTLTLTNDWTLKLGSGFSNGGSVTLFTYGTLTGGADLTPTIDTSSLGFTPSGSLTLTNTGTSIVLNGISVPEPTSVAGLLASGALMAIRRRRRS